VSFGSKIKKISGKLQESSFNPLQGNERTDGNSLESHEYVPILLILLTLLFLLLRCSYQILLLLLRRTL